MDLTLKHLALNSLTPTMRNIKTCEQKIRCLQVFYIIELLQISIQIVAILRMLTAQFWLIVIGFAQMIGCSWIFSMFQKRAYKREIRSRHSYVLLAKLLAEEEKLRCNISKCNEEGTGEVYLDLPEGIVKVFSLGNDRFAISLVGAVIINDLHVGMAREICKDLNTKESRVRYSVGFEPAFSKTGISITCDFEEDGDDETTEYDILSYAKTYLEPKQQELQTIWTQKMEEFQ